MSAAPPLSVIVPVWNGEAVIGRLLDALHRQDADPGAFEIIIVDNGSTDATAAICGRYPRVGLLHEPRPGSYRARNRGIEAAKGQWLLFTDADCVPAPNWIEQALALTRSGAEKTIHAGRITLSSDDAASRAAAEFDALTSLNQELNVQKGYAVTANWLCAKSSLLELGGFRPDLLSGGDFELSRRACAAGWRLRYAPELTVAHPARGSLSELIAKRRRVLGGLWTLKQSHRLRVMRIAFRVVGDVGRQVALLWRSDMPMATKPLVGGVAACVAFAGLAETLRLALGGSPFRS